MEYLYDVLYLVLAGLIVFLSIKLADYVDALDKRTSISGAFIGGVLLAAVTSLPELFTAISAILIVGENGLVIGDVLGSNLFNLAIIAACIIIFIPKLHKAKLDKIHRNELLISLGCTLCVLYACLVPTNAQPILGPVNLLIIPIAGLYVLSIKIQPKESETEDKEELPSTRAMKLPIKTVVLLFVVCAILLVTASIFLSIVTDKVADQLNIGATVAGSIFLAIATSLPELVSTVALCKKGNFNAGFANIVGSNNFNFIILVIGELISFNGSLLTYHHQESFLLTAFLIASIIISIGFMIYHKVITNKVNLEEKNKRRFFQVGAIVFSLLIFSCYVLFLVVNSQITIW